MTKTTPTKPAASKIKSKKKRWFPIFAPPCLGQKEVGESYLAEGESALGRTLKINLRDITGSIYDQSIYLSLKVKEINGSNLQTELIGYNYLPLFFKKLSRRNLGKIEDSLAFKTKDNYNLRLKTVVITAFGANRSVKTAIRNELKKILKVIVTKSTFENLLIDFLKQKMRSDFKKRLGKISPIKELIVREIRLENKTRKVEKEAENPAETEPEEPATPETTEEKKAEESQQTT